MFGASMPSARAKLGRFGEAAAVTHLLRNGFSLIDRNWRHNGGELDLIARQGDQVVFVEVRTRRAWDATPTAPEASVGAAKARRLIELAHAYLSSIDAPPDQPWRIDVIAVEVDRTGRITRLVHIEHAIEE